MKASPGARSWIAAGVRHELLMRALPGLRHDMAAPVSLVRMGLLMLRKQLDAQPPDADASRQRAEQVEAHVGQLAHGLRALRDWELGLAAAEGEGITRAALARQCASLMRAAFDLQGFSLELDEALDEAAAQDEAAPRWPDAPALRYLLLGALAHLHDAADAPAVVRIAPEGDDALAVRSRQRAADEACPPEMLPHRAPRRLAVDAVALQSLADDLGRSVTVSPGAVVLRLAAGSGA